MTFKHLYEHLCVFLNKGDLRSGKYSKYAEKQILTQHLVDFFSFIITLGFNSCTSPCSNHVFSVFIRKAFWEAVRMATNVNTSGPPLPLLLVCLFFQSALQRRQKREKMASSARSEDHYYERITSAQQSIHERWGQLVFSYYKEHGPIEPRTRVVTVAVW